MNDEAFKGNYNSCIVNAVHCAISSADALTVFFKGVRHAGEKHEDVIKLIAAMDIDKEVLKRNISHLSSLLGLKNIAEYEEKLTTEPEAVNAIKNAERFFRWVKGVLGG